MKFLLAQIEIQHSSVSKNAQAILDSFMDEADAKRRRTTLCKNGKMGRKNRLAGADIIIYQTNAYLAALNTC